MRHDAVTETYCRQGRRVSRRKAGATHHNSKTKQKQGLKGNVRLKTMGKSCTLLPLLQAHHSTALLVLIVVVAILSRQQTCWAWTPTTSISRISLSAAPALLHHKKHQQQSALMTVLSASSDSDNSMVADPSESKQTTIPLPHSIQAIIFDIDGTLADSWKLGFDASLVVLEQNHLPTITQEIYHECTRYATPDRLARHAGLEPGTEEFQSVGAKLADEFDNLYVGLVSTETAGFFPGISGILERISEQKATTDGDDDKEIKLGALTNACVAYAHAVLKVNVPESSQAVPSSSSFHSHFESIHGADTVPAPKPEPDGLWLVCKELGVAPEHAVYVGDSPSDAGAAHNAGMASIGVIWGSHAEESLQQAPFTKVCSSIDELQTILRL